MSQYHAEIALAFIGGWVAGDISARVAPKVTNFLITWAERRRAKRKSARSQ